ncbi:hydrolase, partial [Bacillus toyonensis]
MEKKKTYYISIGNGQISQVKTADTYNFEVYANDEEITELRAYFDQAYV